MQCYIYLLTGFCNLKQIKWHYYNRIFTQAVNFCMDHLSAYCTVCWKWMHKVCNVISIEHAVRIVHKSRITLDLEHKIDYLLVKVKDTLQERNDLLVDIEKQRNISMNSFGSHWIIISILCKPILNLTSKIIFVKQRNS